MKKLIPCLLLFFLLFIPIESKDHAFADDRVTVKYYFEDEVILSASDPIGSEVAPLSYATVKSLLKGQERDLTPGTVYEWRKGSSVGVNTDGFIANADTDLYFVPVATGVTRSVTYRYDYFDESNYRSQTIEYFYGENYSIPEQIDGQAIVPRLYKTHEYEVAPNNEIHKPTYVLENMTVYVTTQADAVYTVDGQSRHSAYGQKPDAGVKKDHVVVGLFTDPDFTTPYNGPAINGLTLYVLWQRITYTVTISTEQETTELSLPVDDPILKEKSLPDGYVWTVDSEKITFPYTVDGDVTLTGKDPNQVDETKSDESKKKSLTKDEIIAVSIVGAAFVAVGAYSLVRFLLKKKKTKKDK